MYHDEQDPPEHGSLVHVRTGEVVSLDQLPRLEQELAQVASAESAMNVMDAAEAARVWAQRAHLGVRTVNHATVIKICAHLKLAEIVDQGQAEGVIAKKGNVRTENISTLDDLGVDRVRLHEARKLAKKYTEGQVRLLGEEYSDRGEELSRRQLLSGEAVQQSQTNEWYTPPQYLDAAREVLGGIDLDPATCIEANQTVRAARIYTKDDDGLDKVWRGRVWLNPPYGRIAGDFIEQLVQHYDAGSVTAAIALVNAHCTDTKWFQPLWDHTLCFTDHRINFAAGTDERSGSTHGSVFIYLGLSSDAFAKSFAQFGAIVRRWP